MCLSACLPGLGSVSVSRELSALSVVRSKAGEDPAEEGQPKPEQRSQAKASEVRSVDPSQKGGKRKSSAHQSRRLRRS